MQKVKVDMLMTAMKQPDRITPLGNLLRGVLQAEAGKWLTRNQIAEKLGRSRLTPYDIATLEYLANQGLIEARQATRGVIGKRWEYRSAT